jgi:hypothetical protein
MNDSHLDSERLLAVVQGQARWSAEEAEHLEQCAECRLEWNLVRATRSLGRAPAGRVVPARAAATVVHRLRTEEQVPASVRSFPARWLVGLAAVAAIVFAVLIPGGTMPPDAAASGNEMAVLHELDGLSEAELEIVLETIPPPADAATHVEAAPIGELSATDLERMLHSME